MNRSKMLLTVCVAEMAVIVWSVLVAVAAAPGAADATTTVDNLKLGGVANLAYFAEKVRKKIPVKIGYIGGSITQGAGASQYGNNYFWKSKTLLEQEIIRRGDTVTTYQAAIGGTGSAYACYRVGAQMLVHQPDLLIIEFAVNDADDPNAGESMECLVRQALKSNPQMGIVLFYTTTAQAENQFYAKSLLPRSVQLHHEVAHRYGLTEIMTGSLVDKGIKAGTFTEKAFFRDGVHPSDIGHAFYADTLVKGLLPLFDLPAPASDPPALPARMGQGTLEYARLSPASPVGSRDGWVEDAKQWNWYGVKVWKCDEADKPLTFPARGHGIQIVFQGNIRISWTVGGQEHTRILTGRPNLPKPSQWAFPQEANPDGAMLTVEAVPDSSGKTHGEVWGLFFIDKP